MEQYNSDNAGTSAWDLDRQIRDGMPVRGTALLSTCIGLAIINEHRLYKVLGFKNMAQYTIALSGEKAIKRSRIYGWLRIGQIYLKYQDELEEINFNNSHRPSKLHHLERALLSRERDDVFDKLISLSYDNFVSYSGGKRRSNTRKRFVYDDLFLDKEAKNYLKKINRLALDAIKEGERVFFLRVKDRDEFERFNRAFNRLIRKLRKGTNNPSNR